MFLKVRIGVRKPANCGDLSPQLEPSARRKNGRNSGSVFVSCTQTESTKLVQSSELIVLLLEQNRAQNPEIGTRDPEYKARMWTSMWV